MADQDKRRRPEQAVEGTPPLNSRPMGGGPETTVTVGQGTGPRRDLPDRHAAPTTPKANAGKCPRNREEGRPG